MPLMEVDLDMEDMDMVNISISRIFLAKFGLVPIPESDPKLKTTRQTLDTVTENGFYFWKWSNIEINVQFKSIN